MATPGPAKTGLADQGADAPDNLVAPQTTPQAPAAVEVIPNVIPDPVDDDICIPVTTISAEKTAVGFWEMSHLYSWSIDKVIYENDNVKLAENDNGYDLMIEPGENAMVSYLITADRMDPVVSSMIGVRGTITVMNTGCESTQDLAILDIVQIYSGCGFEDYVSFAVDTSSHPILAAGESYTYDYEFEFVPVDGACYRNVADVTITNFVDHVGENYGVLAMAKFALPCEPTIFLVDDSATIWDKVGTLPCGFTVEALTGVGPWVINGDDKSHFEASVNLLITNVDAPRDSIYQLCNKALLVPEDTCTSLSDAVGVKIYSGALETTLDISKTADVSWTEYIQLSLNFPDASAVSELSDQNVEFAEAADPVMLDSILVKDVGTFTVVGSIMVTNTGCYPTQGLYITDTIQMWDGECWIDLASIEVDLACMSVLGPGESYAYPYELTFDLDNVATISFDDIMLTNVAYAGICNYDDDAGIDGVTYYLPLEVPFLPDMVTMETNAVYHDESATPIGECAEMVWTTDLSYHQLVQITFGDEETRLSVVTDVSATSVLKYNNGCDEVCEDLNTAIHYEACTVVTGEERCAELAFHSMDTDDAVMEVCIMGEPVDVNMHALLCAANMVSVCVNADGFAINDAQMMFYGAFACFVMVGEPVDEPDPTAV